MNVPEPGRIDRIQILVADFVGGCGNTTIGSNQVNTPTKAL